MGPYPVGNLQKTPVEVLNLQVGELVEVKSLEEIKRTLDCQGENRGLHFAPEMIPYCGRRLRVVARADQMIMEGTGLMRSMKNTVILENAICDSATWAFGACPRQDWMYWREIWLKRVSSQEDSLETTMEVGMASVIDSCRRVEDRNQRSVVYRLADFLHLFFRRFPVLACQRCGSSRPFPRSRILWRLLAVVLLLLG